MTLRSQSLLASSLALHRASFLPRECAHTCSAAGDLGDCLVIVIAHWFVVTVPVALYYGAFYGAARLGGLL